MNDSTTIERGSMGRVAYARAPNEDLVVSVERLCVALGFASAFVRGALGQRFHGSNHIRQPRRAYRTRCG
jgi:hypothetical protein